MMSVYRSSKDAQDVAPSASLLPDTRATFFETLQLILDHTKFFVAYSQFSLSFSRVEPEKHDAYEPFRRIGFDLELLRFV